MPCENDKDALVEAAATGVEPSSELRAHLKTCTACQAAWAEEEWLFAEIDAGLRVAANAEVPPSLFPRVRASLEREAVPKPFWSAKWYVLAGASAMLAVLLVAQTIQRTRIDPKSVNSTFRSSPSVASVPTVREQLSGLAAPSKEESVAQGQPSGIGSRGPRDMVASHGSSPEILVPREQEVLLARYAEEWSRRKTAPLVIANESNDIGLTPLEVAPIQIAELDVKLLAVKRPQ